MCFIIIIFKHITDFLEMITKILGEICAPNKYCIINII